MHPVATDLAPFPSKPLPGGPTGHVVVTLTAPCPPLSVNRTTGAAWQAAHTDKLAWQAAGADAAREHAQLLAPYRGHRVRMTWALPVARPGACDEGNYVAGVSVKGGQDGFTRTGLLIPDDTSRWLETRAVFWTGGPDRDEVRIKVECAPAPDGPGEW